MKKEALPELSHLQFAVLDVMGTAIMSGKNVREGLKQLGISKNGPAFYQMMARLEEGKLVEGWYDQKIIDGQIIKERCYKITGDGVRALNNTKRFYASRTAPLTGLPAFV
jgi:hypothetical protein